MAHLLAAFRSYLGVRAAHYTEAQLQKALSAASAGSPTDFLVSPTVNAADARLLDLPDVRQRNDYECGMSATLSVLKYFGVGEHNPDKLSDILGTNVKTSTSPQAIIDYLSSVGLQVEPRQHMTIDDLRQCWQEGRPVICCIQEYGLPSKQASYDYGHWVVVLGAALGQVFVQDPSIDNVLEGEDADQTSGRMMIDEKTWMRNWHDQDADGNKFECFGIAVGPPAGNNRLSHLVTKAHTNGKDHLDRLGGELPMIDPEMLKRADFITYGKDIKEGSNCSSCRYNKIITGQHQCTFHDEAKGIDLRGQVVGPRNCCGEWDAPGTLRSWQSETVTKSWEESKHPRGGDPHNPGRFSHNGGTVPYPAPDAPYPSFPGAPGAKTNPSPPPEPVSRRPLPADYLRRTSSESTPSSSADRSPLHRSLEESPAARTERLDEGVNKSFVLTLEDGTKGVFKPAAGERTNAYGVPAQTGYRREVAASRIADILGLSDLVPVTTFRGAEGDDIGSMQAFVPETLSGTKSAQPFDGPKDHARAAAFDYLLLNHDRHFGNWLLVHNKKLTLIDNGTSLPVKYDRDAIAYTQSYLLQQAVKKNMPLPDLSGWRGKWEALEKEMRECGIEDEAIQLAQRRFADLTSGKHKDFASLPGFGVKDTLGELVKDRTMRLWYVGS